MSWGASSTKQQELAPGISKATQALLSDVMQKRGLSIRAMQDVSDSMQRGDGKWADHLNTSTASYKAPASKTKSTVKVPKYSGAPTMPMPMPPASFSGKRMMPEILKVAPPEREMFRGGAPAPNREAEKDRFSKVMEHGTKKAKELEQKQQQMALEAQRPPRPVDAREEMINQVVEEVRERREFLEALQAAGGKSEYEATVKTEIAVRLKELERMGLDVQSSRPAKVVNPNQLRIG